MFASELLLLFTLAPADACSVELQPGSELRECADCPSMRVIAAGVFEMGAVPGDALASPDELPRHAVRIGKPFAIGESEVTRAQYAAFLGASGYDAGNRCSSLEGAPGALKWLEREGRSWEDPGFSQTDQHPVVCVSWSDASAYARWLVQKTGKPYRLPTEAEWEYVARAGQAANALPSHELANYGAETASFAPLALGADRWLQTAPVGSFPADLLGLRDIRGNVWEWLADCYHENYLGAPADGSARSQGCSMADRRSVRGGGWGDAARLLRPSYRLRGAESEKYFTLGFRVARSIE